ncbi:MAG: TIGR04283 family arsenosugar biosynthesis glycosyltransferase [Planctomycetes bacterium]|nr:TIGR04283 family arsenosugar biosynthesis glycosyltransferase [Planctomycetota bacterium]
MLSISAIIPTLNEEADIAAAIASVRRQGPREIIVVDGGSADRTVERARESADRVVVEDGGLPSQLNRGAREACGEALLFLYADTRLPEGGLEAIAAALADPAAVGGAFRLDFESRRRRFRCIAGLSNLRNRLGFGPFGDQAIFARREVFHELGGYRPEAFLEDLDLVRRLKRRGRFTLLRSAVRTSARQWEKHGFLKTTLCHGWMSLAYLLGKRRKGPVVQWILDYLRSRR